MQIPFSSSIQAAMAQVDLVNQIEFRSLECLNASPSHGADNALKQGLRDDDAVYLESDTDEQLLLHVPFSSAVRIAAIVIKSAAHPDQAPAKVRLFINRPTIGFGDAQDLACTQDLQLDSSTAEGQTIPLKLVKFQKVSTLTIFVESNLGDEESTIIQQIKILGYAGDTFNVNEIKKVEED